MKILEIQPLENGTHNNRTTTLSFCPIGWAVIPEDLETPNFPFGKIEVEEIDSVMTVTKWIAGEIPQEEKKEIPVTKMEQLRADIDFLSAIMGVEL